MTTNAEFWEARAVLGPEAGTRDLIAKQLEVEFLCGYVAAGMRILDAGCGNGIAAVEMARRAACEVVGFDRSPAMITAAQQLLSDANIHKASTVTFGVGDVVDPPRDLGLFDLVYTERVLVNLADWPTQYRAIGALSAYLKPGGRYVMVENSQDAVERLNSVRVPLGLAAVVPPAHNRYLREDEVAAARPTGLSLTDVRYFTSTYYFLSRVVNATLAAEKGEEPAYDSPINQLALRLPGDLVPKIGQGVAWVWKRQP
jgi:ubiquinone/menaquinone biosynthesis C-methylase UbiE